jgi:hypothetical protein
MGREIESRQGIGLSFFRPKTYLRLRSIYYTKLHDFVIVSTNLKVSEASFLQHQLSPWMKFSRRGELGPHV